MYKRQDKYHEELASKKLIDFDQILHYAHKLILAYPKISEILKNMFHLVCVDEYQDTQQLQYAILAKIMKGASGKCKMFFVGDSDQAIYGSVSYTHLDVYKRQVLSSISIFNDSIIIKS